MTAAAVATVASASPEVNADAARAAGLRYVSDSGPGIRRHRRGGGFVYLAPDGSAVRDTTELRRIRGIAVPPAWTEVWICPRADGHLQATGRDARGRKQYRYHPGWREVRDQTKFARMVAFGTALPAIRRRVDRDLALPGLPRDKVLAGVVRLLDISLVRVGNQEYARQNASFGITTLRTRHVDVHGARIRLRFRGKSGREHEVDVNDPRLARVVRRCQSLPGQELLQYVDDDGERRSVDSGDVNEYLREITGEDVTAKDFRTWAGTVLTACALADAGPSSGDRAARRAVAQAVTEVAERLGNTPAVARRCYVHPDILDAYMEGAGLGRRAEPGRGGGVARPGLRPEEREVLDLLRRRARAHAGPRARARGGAPRRLSG